MTLSIAEVLEAARQRGLTKLPEPSQLTVVRVWSTGIESRWIAEVGEPPSNWPVGAVFDSEDEAQKAGFAEGEARRSQLADALRSAGADDIADAEWEPMRLDKVPVAN